MKTVQFQNGESETNENENSTKMKEAIAKRHQLKIKFNIDKEKLNQQDIITIMKAIDIENKEKENNIIEQSKKLFKELDKKKLGYVNTNDFIEEIINRNDGLIIDEFSEFFQKINESLQTKIEEIILKLKKIQNKNWVMNKRKFLSSIESIISIISNGNLYDLDSPFLLNKNNEGEDFLIKYSQIEDSNKKEEDFKLMRKRSKKYSTNSISLSQNKRRRSTNLNTLVSPSIVASMYDQMSKIDKCDFNIFELDSILGKKTVIYVATEILNTFPFIDSDDIPSNILKNFITQIVEHYDREKAIYHNDLHACDVMQTSYTIFTQGNLTEKMKLKELDTFSMLIAALCHDYKHPGTNNLYQINSKSKYAMRYNDFSVLEMYHLLKNYNMMNIIYLKNFHLKNIEFVEEE